MPDSSMVLCIPWFSLPWDVLGDGTRRVEDLSGYGNHGTPTGFAGTDVEFIQDGTYGQIVTLSGTNQYVDFGAGDVFNPHYAGWTTEVIFKTGNVGSTVCLYAKSNGGAASTTYGYLLAMSPTGALYFYVATAAGGWGGGARVRLNTTGTYNDDNWYHVVVSIHRSGNADSFFLVNGQEDMNVAGDIAQLGDVASSVNFVVGAESDVSAELPGEIAAFRHYTRSMGRSEAFARYRNRHRLSD